MPGGSMAHFTILRVQKLKSAVAVRASLKHSYREQDTPNADQNLTPNNSHYGPKDSDEAIDRFNSLVEKAAKATKSGKIRSNAVVAVEFLFTTSPEWMEAATREQQDAYFINALKWLGEKHGRENVVCAGVHRDEKTPHMYAYVVPRDRETGRLNCKGFYGGPKSVMSSLQDEFYEKVGESLGQERGIKGSKARHTRVQDFYRHISQNCVPQIDPLDLEPRVVEKKLFSKKIETAQGVADRLNDKLQCQRDIGLGVAWESLRRRTAEEKAARLSYSLEELKAKTNGLTDKDLLDAQIEKSKKIASAKREQLEKKMNEIKLSRGNKSKGKVFSR